MAIKVQGTTVVDDSRNAEVVTLSINGTPVTATPTELNKLDGATVTTDELNILDGATVTTAELNKLDGATVTTDELNILNGATVTTAELNKLDGATVTTDELNILNGATVTTAELNKLDGATVTTAELNKLDGATVTTDELNILAGTNVTTGELDFLSGVTSDVQTQIDNKVNLTSSTGAAILPSGTTAERDASPAAGYLRFNADENSFEGYDGTEWIGIGGGAAAELVASGSIPSAGTSVALLSDGTVEVVDGSSVTEDVGNTNDFTSAYTNNFSAAYDSNAGKVVIVYRDGNQSQGKAIVGTVSGNSISFGSPTDFETNNPEAIGATYEPVAGKIVIAYNENQSQGKGIVGTVSGNSISFGSPTIFDSFSSTYNSVVYEPVAGKIVITYEAYDGNLTSYGRVVVGTVSGDSISFGSPTDFNNGSIRNSSATYDSNAGKIVISYADDDDSNKGKAIVGTVSGDSISFGTPIVFDTNESFPTSITYEPVAGKIVIAYVSSVGNAIVGTVSGDSISFGSPVAFSADLIYNPSAIYDPAAGKIVIAYSDQDNFSYGTVIAGTVSDNSISFDGSVVFYSDNPTSISVVYDSAASKIVIGYGSYQPDKGAALTYNPDYIDTNANDFIGFAQDSASDTDTVLVATNQQIDANQTGLTPKSTYYLDFDGTLTTSDTGYPVAGFALDANTIRTGG